LPLWVEHNRRLVGPDNVFVLDHDSADPDTLAAAHAAVRVPVHRTESFNHDWLRQTVQAFQRFLLHSYRWVLFAEADEIVALDPALGCTLADYLEHLGTRRVARCTGYEVVHDRDKEPPLDWGRPLLVQRRYWSPTRRYSKPALSTVPLEWCLGFHDAEGTAALPPDPRLLLLHLHRVDYDSCRDRHLSRLARKWSEKDLAQGYGLQNRLVAAQEFDQWFYHPEQTSAFMEPLRLQPIPAAWKGLV
jgi:hypothetical protein